MGTQIIKCGLCNKAFAACREPECYTDRDWKKDLRQYIKQGYEIATTEKEFEWCSCKKVALKSKILGLNKTNNLQVSLF